MDSIVAIVTMETMVAMDSVVRFVFVANYHPDEYS